MRNDIDPQYHTAFQPRATRRVGHYGGHHYFRSDEPMHKHYPFYCTIHINRRISGAPTWFLGRYGGRDLDVLMDYKRFKKSKKKRNR